MKDLFTKEWITRQAIDVCDRYEPGVLTLRALHYQLVGLGMTNDINHYKRVVNAMIDARWAGVIDFEVFSDLDRSMDGSTKADIVSLDESIEEAKKSIKGWMDVYYLNRWENQPIYPEVWIEKKALQGVFSNPCRKAGIGLGACKGYPSLTFLYEARGRFEERINEGKTVIILYFGDYDPSGEDIPRAIKDNLDRMGVDVEVRRIALMEHQVTAWGLPPAPTKSTDTRSVTWNGLGQVELDAVRPEMLQKLIKGAVDDIFDEELFAELKEREWEERKDYRLELKEFVKTL